MSSNNFWQLVFNQSKVNGAEYFGDRLPCNSWNWPKDTFLQKRLNELKKRQPRSITVASEANRASTSFRTRKRRQTQHEDPNWARMPDATWCAEGR
jgi:hypothetical protein